MLQHFSPTLHKFHQISVIYLGGVVPGQPGAVPGGPAGALQEQDLPGRELCQVFSFSSHCLAPFKAIFLFIFSDN
jgi:hypothetical protein